MIDVIHNPKIGVSKLALTCDWKGKASFDAPDLMARMP